MRVDLDAKVRTSDGEDAGSVRHAIIDPDTNEVSSFVINTGGIFGRDVMVPREELEKATEDGDRIRLSITKEELKKMPDFLPSDFGIPPSTWVPPSTYGYPRAGYLWPSEYVYASSTHPVTPDEGQLTIDKGSTVLDRNRDDVGVIEDLRFDPDTGKITGAVLRVGGVLQTMFGGGETVEIGRDAIDHVEERIVYLSVDKEHLKGLVR